MNWEKYYTPEKVAKEIISLIPNHFIPSVVIDICAGKGNFLEQAKLKWPNCRFIAVDINSNLHLTQSKFETHQFDALRIKYLQKKLVENHVRNKLILANPPFGYKKSNYKYPGNFLTLFNMAKRLNRIEALMLVSNINILTQGDYFGGVIPENIFESSKLSEFKREFISLFDNIILSKPKKSFRNSEVRTRIFVGRFVGENLSLNTLSNKNTRKFSRKNIFRGVDNSKLVFSTEKNKFKRYSEVIHFNSSSLHNIKFKYIEYNKKLDKYRVRPKDILLLRVGRNTGSIFWDTKKLEGKLISDHFIILRDIEINQKTMFQDLIRKNIKGLTTKYITNFDIENCILDTNVI